MLSLAKEFVSYARELYATDEFIPLHEPRFIGNEKKYLSEVVDSTFVSSIGSRVGEFEKVVESYTGAKHAIATVNGTAALHVALRLVGTKEGDEIITQSLTFVATCNAIRYTGAVPSFIDVDPSTLGMSPDSLEEYLDRNAERVGDSICVNKNTNSVIRACVPVHDLGHPVRIKEIVTICQDYGIEVVEDAAESLGSYYDGSHTGLYGKIGTLSFNGNKIITTGGGGMLLTGDDEIALEAKHLTTTAKLAHPWLFIHDAVGYNYRMPNLNASLGCAQMEQLDFYLENKRQLAGMYSRWFEEKGIELVKEPAVSRSNYWLNSVRLESRDERDEFLSITNELKVMTRPLWTPMHTLSIHSDCSATNLIETEKLENTLVCLPSSVRL